MVNKTGFLFNRCVSCLLTLIGSWLVGVSINAQTLLSTFATYNSLDGLVHNNVLDIYTDSKGFVWLCTWNGVSRFDGYHFKNYCNDPDNSPVLHNRFISVGEDGNTHLWFTTYDGRLYRFNRFMERFERIDEGVTQLTGRSWRVGHLLFCRHTKDVWVEFQGFGLVRFQDREDGSPLSSTNYMKHELIASDITCLDEGKDGTVWIVCGGNKIVTLSAQDKIKQRYIADEPIIGSVVMGMGMAYVTRNTVILLDSCSVKTVTLVKGGLTTIAGSEERQELYVGTKKEGVKVLKIDGERLTDVTPKFGGSQPKGIEKLNIDSHNTLWITDKYPGIIRLDIAKGDYKRFCQKLNTVDYFPDTLSEVSERNEVVWLKMKRGGFGYYNREKDQVEAFYNDASSAYFRMTNGITTFEVDHNNVIWLSPYYEKGLIRGVIGNSYQDVYHFNDILSSRHLLDDVRALETDHLHNLWIGTKNGMLYCYDEHYKLIRTISHASGGKPLGRIYSLFEDSMHRLWIGTKGNGLWRLTFHEGEYTFRHYVHEEGRITSLSDNSVYSITEDNSGRLWIATYEGGINMLPDSDVDNFINIDNGFPNYPHHKNERVRFLLSDTEDRMLAATTEGLLIFNPSIPPDKMQFTLCQRYPDSKNSIGGNDIIHLLKDSSNQVWLSTYGGGISVIKGYLDNDVPVFVNYTEANGLPSNIILAATEDHEGNIWFSTEKGLVKWESNKHVFTSYAQWSYYVPVSYDEASAITDVHGNVIFGGMNKLHVIEPLEMQVTLNDYNLEFTGLEVQNRSFPFGDFNADGEAPGQMKVQLPYDYSHFRIEFASLNFRIQDKVNYMYQLEGFDEGWTFSKGVNSAYYSKVSPGNYVFRVKAYVGNEFMASPEQTLILHIATPPWLSWYAYFLYTLVLILILGLVGRGFYMMTKLRAETKMEQQVSEMKMRFFTNISHELRTPLTLIMGGLEDLHHREDLSQHGQDSLNMSYKNSKRMLRLINQILDFRKVVKDRLELNVLQVDIALLAKEVFQDFRDMADSRHISLLLTTSHPSVIVWIDKERMESVLYNLLSNAFKYTQDGGRISLSVIKDEKYVTLWVEDSGVGIPKEQQDLIFARFSQFKRLLSGKVYGTGIGLALCKEIVELHHGKIEVESKVGKGSTFIVRLLPGNLHFEMGEINFETHGVSGASTMPIDIPTHKMNDPYITLPEDVPMILLVDDNIEMRRFISGSLIENYRVTEACDGVEAWDKIRQKQPDIVITDLLMPRMDGIALVDKIRQDFETSHIPIIMLTARHTSEDRLKALKYGADSYLTKPFSMELLLAYIDNLLNQRRLLFERFSSQAAVHHVTEFVTEEVADVIVTNRDQKFMKKLMDYIDENIQNSELTVNDLAVHLNLGRTTMYNKIKSLTGKSPIELIKEYRITKAEALIKNGEFSVSELAYSLGFSDPSYFSRCFKERYKVSPKDYMHRYVMAGKKGNEV